MNKIQSRPILNRRDFLKLLAAAGVTLAGGYGLVEYAPWLGYDQQTNRVRRPFEKDSTVLAQMRELIRYATLAANGHNTQPWKFTIKEKAIEIHPDHRFALVMLTPCHGRYAVRSSRCYCKLSYDTNIAVSYFTNK
jgi:hypothetical protein